MDSQVLGILGGGQLGRMMVEAANRLNIKTVILDAENSPAKQISSSEHITGKFTDPEAVKQLAAKCDVLTIEIEHVNVDALRTVAKTVQVFPSPNTIALIQDKFAQKQHLIKHDIAVATSEAVEGPDGLLAFGEKHGFPFMLKSRRDAYDGRGNFVVKSPDSIGEALASLNNRELYAEKWAPFTKELAAMVVRGRDGKTLSYPVVETVHKNNICHTVYAPAQVDASILERAAELARNAVACLPQGAGIFGVEMFVLESGELLINEIAPRPHNSGHYTQDACVTSQFEAVVRAVLGLPLPEGMTDFTTNTTNAVMLNLLGAEEANQELDLCQRALEEPGTAIHLYGKASRPKRKVGHINIVSSSMAQCVTKLNYIENATRSRLPPRVGVIMGSDSDLPVMKAACKVLQDFDVPFVCSIVSAHRTPDKMVKFAKEAEGAGISVIIAGAGGAAHLPGMVAACTVLPVIGVPVKGSTLDGVDSLHSIVQMPRGVPVATVAINNAMNAGLLALRILGAGDSEIRQKLHAFADQQADEVYRKDEKLLSTGYSDYSWP